MLCLKGGISDGDFEKTSLKHPKIYCSHCEEYIRNHLGMNTIVNSTNLLQVHGK